MNHLWIKKSLKLLVEVKAKHKHDVTQQPSNKHNNNKVINKKTQIN